MHPRIYLSSQGKPVIAFPPEYEPIPIHSRSLRGIISSKFEDKYSPEMIKDAAVRRVEAALAGQAAQSRRPPIETPLDGLKGYDPVLLAVYYFMVGHQAETRGKPFEDYTRKLLAGSRSVAIKYELSVDQTFYDVQLYGIRLRRLMPDFLLLGLTFEFKHKNEGSWVKVAWAEGFPKNPDEKEDGDRPSSKSSPDKPDQTKPLQPSDGRDVRGIMSRLSAKQNKEKPGS